MSAISSRREHTPRTPHSLKTPATTPPKHHQYRLKHTPTLTTETHTTNAIPHPHPNTPEPAIYSPRQHLTPHAPQHIPNSPPRTTPTPAPTRTTRPLAPPTIPTPADAPALKAHPAAGRTSASLCACAHSRPCSATPACPTLGCRPVRRPHTAAVARRALPRRATRAPAAGGQSSLGFRSDARWGWRSGRRGRCPASLPS